MLLSPDVHERLYAAWALGSGAAVASGTEPPTEERRLFPLGFASAKDVAALAALAELDPEDEVRAAAGQFLARLAEPDDEKTKDVLLRVARDPSATVRSAVISNLRKDAHPLIQEQVKQWLQDPALEVQRSTAEAVLRWSESPHTFLAAMRLGTLRAMEYALVLLREGTAQMDWRDVQDLSSELPIMVGLARLFPKRLTPPLSFWLTLAVHPKVLAQQEDVLEILTTALGSFGGSLAPRLQMPLARADARALDSALKSVAEVLPVLDHDGYMELRQAGLNPPSQGAPIPALTSARARLWLALLRLSPNPSGYVLRPRYR